jgi:hypothetical protein
LTTPEAEEQGKTAPIEVAPEPVTPAPPPPVEEPPPAAPPPALAPEVPTDDGHTTSAPAGVVAQPSAPVDVVTQSYVAQSYAPQTLYVPLAVTIGDGFKFGCGFFLALVLAMLVGFVLLAALFVLTSLFGLNLPITR